MPFYKGKTIKARTKADTKREELEIKLSEKIMGKAAIVFEFTGILK